MNETQIEALKKGAAVLYQTLQNVALLHDVTDEEKCQHCDVEYPCPTMRLVLNDFEVGDEETPAA